VVVTNASASVRTGSSTSQRVLPYKQRLALGQQQLHWRHWRQQLAWNLLHCELHSLKLTAWVRCQLGALSSSDAGITGSSSRDGAA
jgi:hypothetical protein